MQHINLHIKTISCTAFMLVLCVKLFSFITPELFRLELSKDDIEQSMEKDGSEKEDQKEEVTKYKFLKEKTSFIPYALPTNAQFIAVNYPLLTRQATVLIQPPRA